MAKMIPLSDRVIVERLEPEAVTAGGIVIPDSATEKPGRGVVIAVGPGEVDSNGKLKPTSVQKGQKVLFGKYSGTEVKIDGNEFIVMRESDLMAVLED